MLTRSTCLILLLLVMLAGAAVAQDAHYWNTQYGNRAYLLGGAVIGSSNDVSAVYYNPALLTVSAKPNLTVAGNAFYSTSVTLRNALGAQLDIESSSIGAVPTLVAGEIPSAQAGTIAWPTRCSSGKISTSSSNGADRSRSRAFRTAPSSGPASRRAAARSGPA
jgi:hypothetical protein